VAEAVEEPSAAGKFKYPCNLHLVLFWICSFRFL